MRIGHGYDVHKFGGNGPIIMGGVAIEYEQGLLAHSDGDVLLHAICDALLGAIGQGDIGRHFPDTDAQFENINSRHLLKSVMEKVQEHGYQIGNIDCTIVAQVPKMSPYIQQMQVAIAEELNTVQQNVNVKATTTEKLGFVGRGEGIECHAVVLLEDKAN